MGKAVVMSTYGILKHQHTSLQFSDSRDQQHHDIEKLFAKGTSYPIKTGTESAKLDQGNDNHRFLVEFAEKFNHAIHFAEGNWVAIDRDIVKRGSLRKGRVFVAGTEHLFGRQRDREFPTVTFRHEDDRMGRFGVAGFHYSTHGKLPNNPNWDTNRVYAHKIFDQMDEWDEADIIALGAGDFNMIDAIRGQDWAFGKAFTSMADELGRYKDTGHGPIDGFVSMDRQKRVKALDFQVLRDNKLHLYADHFVCRGTWRIRHLKL
jgi:hypothetical protein